MRIGIFYGSSMGNTEEVAQCLCKLLSPLADEPREVYGIEASDLEGYDALLLGIPTWHIGEMQDDWVEFAPGVAGLDLSGVRIGLFGCGDQAGYPTTFGDALGLLWDQIKGTGVTLIGTTSTEGYEFESSKGVGADGRFLGLLVDNDNEQDLTDGRVEGWAEALRVELGVGAPAASQ